MNNSVEKFRLPCSGCGACQVVCPKKAIEIKLNDEGFYSAFVEEELCVNCGICTEVCMRSDVHTGVKLENANVKAAQSKLPDEVKSCTSGGIASQMSRYAFSKGIGVVGVNYNYKTDKAETKVAASAEELETFKGSKYIQSYSPKAFEEMLLDMKENEGKEYIVFGTPCQIYGLGCALEKWNLRDQAVLVDLFCHGVPSYIVWNEYVGGIKKQLGADQLSQLIFREKSIGWHNFVIKASFGENEYKQSSEGDLFYKVFFDNVLFNKACFNCFLRKEESKADIRLGDYWGKRYQEREDGVSVIFLMTEKGENFLQETRENLTFLEAGTPQEVMHAQSVGDYKTAIYREKAFEELKKGEKTSEVIKNYRKRFSFKRRLIITLKEGTSKLPDSMRAYIRKVYRKL